MLIHAGDFSNVGMPKDVIAFSEFLGSLPHKHKIVIAGNHDLTFDADSYDETWRRFRHPEKHDVARTKALLQNCIYLEGMKYVLWVVWVNFSQSVIALCLFKLFFRSGSDC